VSRPFSEPHSVKADVYAPIADRAIAQPPKSPTKFLDVDYPEDDSDFDYVDDGDDAPSVGGSESEYDHDIEIESPQVDDALVLYSDILPNEAPILLAHLPTAHMTRSRYMPPSPFLSGRSNQGISDDEAQRNCVICMTELRVIICWPCRCLSLCDECRGSLAARSPASKHHCPCCRQPYVKSPCILEIVGLLARNSCRVEGYSRIFIP
jgi:hypothetical protein